MNSTPDIALRHLLWLLADVIRRDTSLLRD